MALYEKFGVSGYFSKGSSPVSNFSSSSNTPKIIFPIYSKFSSRLIDSLPVSNVSRIVSYSSLLTRQEPTRVTPLLTKKKVITSYKPYSKIHERKSNLIYLNNLEFSKNLKIPRLNIKLKNPRNKIKSFLNNPKPIE
jgi:hypothetical protein